MTIKMALLVYYCQYNANCDGRKTMVKNMQLNALIKKQSIDHISHFTFHISQATLIFEMEFGIPCQTKINHSLF